MIHAEAYFLWNAAFCAICLLVGGKLAGLSAPRRGMLPFCALLGGGGALGALLFPPLQIPLLLLWPLSLWLCYREEGNAACLRAMVTTACAALALGGGATMLRGLGQSPALSMALSGLLCLLLWTLARLLPTAFCEVKQLELGIGGLNILLPAMVDSGNLLRDPLTGLPVLVVSQTAVRSLFPEYLDLCDLQDLPMGFRLLSVRTASGRALWPLFRPEVCRIYVNGRAQEARALVAVSGEYQGIQALVPLQALPSSAAAAAPCTASEAAV